jgi:plastocyanin domain-containing protein
MRLARRLQYAPPMTKRLKNLLVAVSFLGATGAGLTLADAKKATPKPKEVQVTVTSAGFEPAEIKAKKGEPLRLVITRKTEKTCATEVVIKDLGVNQKLPLNEAVTVDITPKKDGQLRYACSMDMIAGVITVE